MTNSELFKRLTIGAKFKRVHKIGFDKNTKNSSNNIREKSNKSIELSKESSNEVISRKRKIEENSDTQSNKVKIFNDKISSDFDFIDYTLPEKKKKISTIEKNMQVLQEEINHFRNVNNIHVFGHDISDPIQDFNELISKYSFDEKVLFNLNQLCFNKPSVVEMQAIPAMLDKRDIMVCAPTGSGKTLAFALPIIHQLKTHQKNGFRSLIVAPTRELALQIKQEFLNVSCGLTLKCRIISKSKTSEDRQNWLKSDVLITTPLKLVNAIKKHSAELNLQKIEWLIVDESDKLFEEGKTGFRNQLAIIYKACQSKILRTAFFSATFSHEVEEWCQLNMDNLIRIYIGSINSAAKSIDQQLVYVGSETGKLFAIRNIFQKGFEAPVLIFVQSKERAEELFHELIYDGMNVDVIHSDKSDAHRDVIIDKFRSGRLWILICTELMGRGIDFKQVNLVINYDFPNSAIQYIHRIGRTGRAGRKGKAITFFTDSDSIYLKSVVNLMKQAGCKVPEYMLKIKGPSKKLKKKLETTMLEREPISPEKQEKDDTNTKPQNQSKKIFKKKPSKNKKKKKSNKIKER